MGMGIPNPSLLGDRFRPRRRYSKFCGFDFSRGCILHSAVYLYFPTPTFHRVLDEEVRIAGR